MDQRKNAPKPRLLYVDDENANLMGFKALFRRRYEVIVAESGRAALEILRSGKIEILIADQRMPGMTGAQLLEQTAREFPDVIRFMLTGYSDFDPLVEAINKGQVQGYFTKPLDAGEITTRIEKSLRTYYLEQENRRLHAELVDNERFLEAIVENIPHMIAAKDARDLTFRRLNRAGEAMLDIDRWKLIGKTDHDLCPAPLAEAALRTDRDAIESRSVVVIPEETLTTRQGDTIYLRTIKIPIFGEGGAPQYLLRVSEDITERKRLEAREKKLEAQLRQVQKMEAIGTLAGGIAHDFNNILAPIIGYTEMLISRYQADPKTRENLEAVLNAGLRARELVRQILTFSRRKEQECHLLHLPPIIKETVKLLRSSLPTTIEIRQEIEAGCGPVMGDATQIHQVILNLCTNAFHAMRENGGTLEVCLKALEITRQDQVHPFPSIRPGRYLNLSVSDTGCGMTPEIRERIFEPYFTTKSKEEGTGLGLSLVHGIVKTHGGTTTVYSEPGAGTTFHIFLPVALQTTEPEVCMPDRIAPVGTERILLVDDEKELVRMTRQMLESLGYQVTPFTSSLEASRAFIAAPDAFDLVISDLTMPEMTGLQLFAEMKKVLPGTRMLLCTGFSEAVNTRKAAEMGIQGYIMKPVAFLDLAETVRRILDAPLPPDPSS